jgi:hypothetical protein
MLKPHQESATWIQISEGNKKNSEKHEAQIKALNTL